MKPSRSVIFGLGLLAVALKVQPWIDLTYWAIRLSIRPVIFILDRKVPA